MRLIWPVRSWTRRWRSRWERRASSSSTVGTRTTAHTWRSPRPIAMRARSRASESIRSVFTRRQTGAVSEHKVRRIVSNYRNYADVATLEARVRDLVVARKMDREIARALNADGLLSAHGRSAAAVRSI